MSLLVLLFIFFLQKDFARTKSTKSTKSTKTKISEKVTFFPLDVFYAHKNTAFLFLFAYMRFCA